jgi:peptide/nickel transport system permease protein
MHSNTLPDYVASLGGIVWRAMPNFWLAVMLLTLLVQSQSLVGVDWDGLVVPIDAITGNPNLTDLHRPSNFLAATKKILPASVVLGSAAMGNEMRIGRTAVLETKQSKYVDFAKSRGVSERAVVWKHILRNSLIPLVPLVTSEAFLLIGGSVLVETVFGIQGMGFLFFRAAIQGDLPLIGALMFMFIVVMLAINILQDILYTVIDPRVGYDGT